MKKKRLKVGVIGLGRISPRHIEDSILPIKELELGAVCDVVKKKVKEQSKKYGVKGYTDYKKMLKDEGLDIIAVCSLNGLHYQMGMDIAESGKHCVMEKPIALNYKDAQNLIKAFKKSEGQLFPVLQVRFTPAIKTLKDMIDQRLLGKINTGSVVIRWTRPPEYYKKSKWRASKKMDGGGLVSQSIHYIDAMEYILGKPKKVFAKVETITPGIETEDSCNALVEFNSGAKVNFEFTLNTYPHNLECSFTILGEMGSIKLGGRAMNEVEIWEVKNIPQPSIPKRALENGDVKVNVGVSPNHKLVYKNLINVLMDGKKSVIDGRDAAKSLKLIDAMKESSKKKKEVKV